MQFSDSQTDANGQNILMTTSLITANKHVQTSDEVDSDPSLELRPVEEALLVESSIPPSKTNIRPWITDCLLVGALFASLVLLFYLGGESENINIVFLVKIITVLTKFYLNSGQFFILS